MSVATNNCKSSQVWKRFISFSDFMSIGATIIDLFQPVLPDFHHRHLCRGGGPTATHSESCGTSHPVNRKREQTQQTGYCIYLHLGFYSQNGFKIKLS